MGKAAGNTIVMVLGLARLPAAVGVNATVHGTTEPAVCGTALKPTPVTTPAEIDTALSGEAGALSSLVETMKPAAGLLPEVGFVMPAMVSVAGVLGRSAQSFASVIVTTCPTTVPVVGQVPVKLPVSATVAVPTGSVNPAGNVTEMVSGA